MKIKDTTLHTSLAVLNESIVNIADVLDDSEVDISEEQFTRLHTQLTDIAERTYKVIRNIQLLSGYQTSNYD